MRTLFLTSLVGMMIVCGAANAAATFDLECTGTMKELGKEARPWTVRYRIDLGTRTFCVRDCEVVLDIASVTTSSIVLSDDADIAIKIDRVTGELRSRFRHSWMSSDGEAKCEPKPFSGMPKAKF